MEHNSGPSWDEYLSEDADNYFTRNQDRLEREGDPVLLAIARISNATNEPKRILEVGCSNGWRLEALRRTTGAQCFGIDASRLAIEDGRRRHPDVDLRRGVAPEALQGLANKAPFDVIILGFFLYLLPPDGRSTLAEMCSELLSSHGHIVLHDFLYPTTVEKRYAHHDSLRVYKGDFSDAWQRAGGYFLVERSLYWDSLPPGSRQDPDDWVTVDTLRRVPSPELHTDVAIHIESPSERLTP